MYGRFVYWRSRKVGPLFGAILCAVLAGCAGNVVIGTEYVNASYRNSNTAFIGGGKRQLRVVVEGNPFNVTDAAFKTAVIDRMQGRNFGAILNFSTDPTNQYRGGRLNYRVVLLFNPNPDVRSVGLCRRPSVEGATGAAAAPGRLRVLASYCQGEMTLTRLAATASATSPADPGFDNLMGQITLALFPTIDQNDNDTSDASPLLRLRPGQLALVPPA